MVLPTSVSNVCGESVGPKRSINSIIAPTGVFQRIALARIDDAEFLRTFEDRLAVAAHNASPEATFLQSQSERAANQAGSDDCDLANSHEVFVLPIVLYRANTSAP